MKIKFAECWDIEEIHRLMLAAFLEYKEESPPSSALKETPQTILKAFENGEHALISYMNDEPSGMVRYQYEGDHLYFYRLSVIPERRGNGTARKMLRFLEELAIEKGVMTIFCKVRMSAPKNIYLYQSMGYEIYNEAIVEKPGDIKLKVITMVKKL